MPVLAYFLTWTTYGTWLHGDERGSVDDEHNAVGTALIDADRLRLRSGRRALREDAFTLDAKTRPVVERAIRDHAEHRRWRIDALSARSNHVHVVVAAPSHPAAVVAGQFKSWATRRLRESGLIGERRRVWTKMASTRILHTEASRSAVVDYVRNFQDPGRRSFK
ncbi:MAG: transposase [Phycisphaeraceae bacterium]|nr:MAG: transposase [Phycisphaeraceae bacterium]